MQTTRSETDLVERLVGQRYLKLRLYNNSGNVNGTDDLLEVNMKMYSAFAGVTSFPLKRIIFQFWRPQIDHGRLVLQCLRNPYAVSTYNLRLGKYRSCCTKYRYSVVEGDSSDNPPWFISGGGPVVTAFLNHFPEVVLDLRVLQGSDPLVDCGLECDLMCSVMLPVFHVGSSDCVGVVECSMKHPTLLLPMFNELKCELEVCML
ncbi:hypothetical protein HanPI659440_Chr04g0146111 [Helianthus annuus]|nr:hypothetical protein HanPI659440_Chr04g0146111 [Helianthus annuus]